MLSAVLDHLVVAAATLEQGEDYFETRLGVRPLRGGKHVAMGTHNSLLKLGEKTYLEVIAIDPTGVAPGRARWFGLDTTALRTEVQKAPRLIHWVARTDDIFAARRACPVDCGEVHAMARGAFEWWITIPADGHLPGDGLLPTLIQWADERHPADAMPDADLRLLALAGAHPDPAAIRSALAALSLEDTLKVTFAVTPRLATMLQTTRGPVAF
ncbi:MAG: VOC family protein [Pseudomonadota bacterium]|nr:VOC family protein [Pseudomonadota bacterium]